MSGSPAIFDVEEANRILITVTVHRDLSTYTKGPGFNELRYDSALPNVFFHARFYRGDVEKGFEGSGPNIRKRFSTARIHHAALEPHDIWVAELYGGLTVWVGR